MVGFQGPDIPLIIAATIDCRDVDLMLEFWSQLLGVENRGRIEHFGFLGHATDRKVTLWFQEVPEPKQVKNRVHLDFAVPDLDAAEQRVIDLGGSLGERHDWHGYLWRTCMDPEGNEFDIMQAQSEESASASD